MAMGDAASAALGANPLASLLAVCPFDPASVVPMEFDFRQHLVDNKVKDQESGKGKDKGDQPNASPGTSNDEGTDKESGKRKDNGQGVGQNQRQWGISLLPRRRARSRAKAKTRGVSPSDSRIA